MEPAGFARPLRQDETPVPPIDCEWYVQPAPMKLRWNHPLWRRQAPALARRLVQAYLLTCPSRLVAPPAIKELIASGPPVIYTTWHCHLLSPLFIAHRYRGAQLPMVLMASPSRDGEFIADVARGLGFTVSWGPGARAGSRPCARWQGGLTGGTVAA